MKQEIINCFSWLVNRVAEGYVYTTMDDKLVRNESKEAFEAFYKEAAKFIDFKALTKEDALQLRFKTWDDELPHLMLFPLWMLPVIPEGLTVYDLDGNPYEFKKADADSDQRMGCLSFGLMIGGIDMPLSKKKADDKEADKDTPPKDNKVEDDHDNKDEKSVDKPEDEAKPAEK